MPADYECADLGGSDLASCEGSVADGAPIDTAAVGPKTFAATASDGAGNNASASASYLVVYDFSGFFAPVDHPPTFNVMPAEKGVQVSFSLAGNKGLNIFAPGSPESHPIACDAAAPQDKVEKTVKANSSGLVYNSRLKEYVYTWATNRTWRGSCRELVLELTDGTEHRALFRFT